tara:strand:- start:173 stop:559 length:387 start_codon:yes stop_codon:yes gene_type:complete
MEEPVKSKPKPYKHRKSTVLVLQLMPLFVGMVGLYLVSSWAVTLREEFEIPQASPGYYLGLIFIMLALQTPVLIEIYRRRAKKIIFRRVVIAFIALIASLLLLIWNFAPSLEAKVLVEDLGDLELLDD